jgi:hypothetical protein
MPAVDLHEDEVATTTVVVTRDEEARRLSTFLETRYLEWSDLPCPALDQLTPRHAAAMPAYRDRVGHLIDDMERDDLGCLRTGTHGYDYNILRAHVGVPEATV